MTDRLSALPDEILCYLLSFLTMWDSVRTRLLSPRWRYLYDNRSVLNFDAVNVFGSQKYDYDSYDRSKFVRVTNQLLEIKKGRKLNALTVNFSLGNKQASHIDLWVENAIRMGIETLELNIFPSSSGDKFVSIFFAPRIDEKYVLSDQLFRSVKEFHLKCLRLEGCALTFSYGCTSWISHLATLELTYVPLHQKDIECVMSGGLNLTSLRLVCCITPRLSSITINVELPRLKILYLFDSLEGVVLNCPNLVSLVCVEKAESFIFSHVPLLTQVYLGAFHTPGFSLVFDELAKHAPKLQTLSISLTEIQPLPADNTMSCLKKLCITFDWTAGDLFSVTYLLNASPFLETLHLQVFTHTFKEHFPQREYMDIPHFHLKDVNIAKLRRKRREMEFVRYLLKNSVALERIVIEEECYCPPTSEQMGINLCTLKEEEMGYANCNSFEMDISYFFEDMTASYCSSRREEIAKTLLQDLKTRAQLIFKTQGLGVVLKASNLVDDGVQLSRPGSEEHVN